jgi:RimJ/RimL family protein N-acetyltransferase
MRLYRMGSEMRTLRSLRYHVHNGGYGAALSRAVVKIGSFAWSVQEWTLLRVRLEDVVAPRTQSTVEIRHLCMDDLLNHRFFKAQFYPEDMVSRFDSGALCIGAMVQGKLAHVAWMSKGELIVDYGLPTLTLPGGVGIFDMYTLPEFRRRGCQSAALWEICQLGRSGNLEYASAIVHRDNLPSQRVFSSMGFTEAGKLLCRRVFGKARLIVAPSLGISDKAPQRAL